MTRICILLVVLLCSIISFSQKKELEIKRLNLDDFPKVSGTLRVRDPNITSTDKLSFEENGRIVPVNFSGIQASDSIAPNKLILFLVLKTSNTRSLDWYQDLLRKTLNSSMVNPGDQIAIASFNVATKNPRKFVFPQKPRFTDNISILNFQIDSLDFHPKNDAYRGKNQVYLAVNEALELLENLGSNLPKGIIVLSDDRNMEPIFQGEDPVERSKKLDIPIYGIINGSNTMSFEIEDLCNQTYGEYNQVSSTDINEGVAKLQSYLQNFKKRHQGKYVPFTYSSSFKKDGEAHPVNIYYSKEQSAFVINAPSKNMIEWAEANPLIAILLLFFVIVIILLIIFLVKKEKKKRKLESEENARRLDAMKSSQHESERKIQQQNSEIQAIRLQEQKAEQERIQNQQQKAQEEADEIQFKKMLERGNLPWFEFVVGTEQGSYQIASPRLSIGRDNSSDWVIAHPTVSRKHIELTFLDYTYTLTDLGSSNGTFVNGQRITSIELKHGDVIQLGEAILTFHI
jgi:hypothetical protein